MRFQSSLITYPDPRWGEKTNLNFYFHLSFWYLKRFYEGLNGLDHVFLLCHMRVLEWIYTLQ